MVSRSGPFQTQLLIETLQDLRQNLRRLGTDLYVRVGSVSDCVPAFAAEVGKKLQEQVKTGFEVQVRWHGLPGTYERNDEANVERELLSMVGIKPLKYWDRTLWDPAFLPFRQPQLSRKQRRQRRRDQTEEVVHGEFSARVESDDPGASVRWRGLPPTMGEFRRAAGAVATVTAPLAAPTRLHKVPGITAGQIPKSVRELATDAQWVETGLFGMAAADIKAVIWAAADPTRPGPRGGEEAALVHLEQFVAAAGEDVRSGTGYDASRTAAAGTNSGGVAGSAMISPYLAIGSLSPRTVYAVCRKSPGASWVAKHLEIRDWFIVSACAAGKALFLRDRAAGSRAAGKSLPPEHWRSKHDSALWSSWASGSTGFPLIDAGMRELVSTGWLSNRCRQNCASFLAKDIRLDWRLGAEFFQWLLVDHDVASNWGNWRYFAGVGSDPKQRHFRTISQSIKYDPDATYIKQWLPRKFQAVNSLGVHLKPLQIGQNLVGIDPLSQLTWRDQQKYFPGPYAIDKEDTSAL